MSDLKWDKAFALEQVADDEGLLQELVEIFKESALSDLAGIQQGIEKGDAVMGEASAHSIKGAAASLGFHGLREVTEAMETDCRNGSLGVVTAQLPELEKLLDLLQEV
ncbi:MAG: Hpt domain-containing protein [Desulfocapsa sp.]|uniref:Hpt domain-containing protein n=1 Tax=Desulfotalea psychrophila TaxID=84980 RepID=A0ABS3ASQ2_9BACT|nr:Hpt domain-containing protein [Desulfocapsa sp.]MBN4067957.1 Hpt domain-containing protein [Desulfotalea psychrophila]